MTNFSDNFPIDDIFNAIGDTVTYKHGIHSTTMQAAVNYNVERIGNDGLVMFNKVEIELIKSKLSQLPQRNDQIIVGNKHYTVDAVVADDGVVISVAVR